MKRLVFALCVLLLAIPVSESQAEDAITVWVDPSRSVDVYWGVNLSGTIYVAADVDGRPACLEYWWIRWPTTSVKPLGRHCGAASFSIPSLADFAIGGKLRAGGADTRTRIRGSASEKVARDFFKIEF
jgi:hypothetical protein